jgi:hypothetical protein
MMQANMATGPSVMGVATAPLTLYTLMTSLANSVFFGAYTPGFNFRIRKMYWIQNAPVTTAAKLCTLTPSISGTNLTGGVVALTSALCTPLGKVVAGSAITGLNQGTESDTITVTGSATTAFVEGSGSLVLEIENLDIPL